VTGIGIEAEGPFGPSAAWVGSARAAALSCAGAGGVLILGVFHGGFAPTAWGISALAALWLTAMLVTFRMGVAVTRGGLALVALAVAYVSWSAASAAWTLSVPRTMFEIERDLVYASVVAVALLLPRPDLWHAVYGVVAGLVALLAGAVAVYLASAPVFDATQGYLLSRPLGYANALGVLAVLALPPTLAQAATRRSASAAAVVLLAVLFLTHNRSAALGLALALVVWVGRTEEPGAAAATLFAVAVPACGTCLVIGLLGVDTRAHRLLDGAAIAAAAAIAPFVPRPLPSAVVARRATLAALPAVALGAVFAATKLGDRVYYWRAAWHAFRMHALAGSGAGTFDVEWFRYREVARTVRDAHNLYLTTLAELGIVGLVLLLALLATPLVCARRTRDTRLAPFLASYCAFLVHAVFEWDWKFPLVTGVALVMGVVLVASTGATPVQFGRGARTAAVGIAVVAGAFALVTLAGNSRVATAEHRLAAGDAVGAAAAAEQARRYLPWSSEPWIVLADAEGRSGDIAAARVALRAAAQRDTHDWGVWVRVAASEHGPARATAIRRAFALNPLLARR
jgi:O-antigen ligase